MVDHLQSLVRHNYSRTRLIRTSIQGSVLERCPYKRGHYDDVTLMTPLPVLIVQQLKPGSHSSLNQLHLKLLIHSTVLERFDSTAIQFLLIFLVLFSFNYFQVQGKHNPLITFSKNFFYFSRAQPPTQAFLGELVFHPSPQTSGLARSIVSRVIRTLHFASCIVAGKKRCVNIIKKKLPDQYLRL